MMEFRTSIKTTENLGIISHSDKVMLIGSCFSDNIGARMRNAMMNVLINPFGTIYNPMSIAQAIGRVIDDEPVKGSDIFTANGVWNSYDFHSRYSMADKQATIDRMNKSIEQAHSFLKTCDTLIITLGTAVVYKLRENGNVVANCHKLPQNIFNRELATVEEITVELNKMLNKLHSFNPELKVIFTVSPIRHIADGLNLNSLSKATLLVGVNNATQSHNDFCLYFPAYEIMLDDLRDYRFYATDMIHPNEVAIEYIWQTFQATYCDDNTTRAIARCERVSKRLNHRPMSNNHSNIERFNADTVTVVKNLVSEYPYLNDIDEIKQRLQ
ncbi:MAG: GSCFA domain-containing protein [Muribaculaceae bacterium]|nr:GSCFA domain-containing protein [Muribaculaceae bacterium]